MNSNKKNSLDSSMNSGWILCPSKTFPGKLYYFNVMNGETAWSIGDAEKKIIKKDGGIQKVTSPHHHPEPTSPPILDQVSTVLNTTMPSFSVMRHPTPVFGQSVFPKTVQRKEEPNVIWTPIQIQVPIILAQDSRIQANQVTQACVRKESKSQINLGKTEMEISKDMLVHSCKKPLFQRFVNYEKPVIDFDKDNKIIDKKQFEKFYTSSPIKKSKVSEQTAKPIASDTHQPFQSKNNLSFSDLKHKTQQKHWIKEPVLNIEVPSKTPGIIFNENKLDRFEPQCYGNKAGIAMASSARNNDVNDLRVLLLAKRRKSLDSGVMSSTEEMGSNVKIHTSTPERKKRVTFNLNNENISRIDIEDEDVDFKEKYAAAVHTLKKLAGPGMRTDLWYIIVDAEVLLEDFSFLDSIVRIDGHCKLVVPPAVHAALCAAARGAAGGRARVATARHLVRKLPNAYTIVQSGDSGGMNSPTNDNILKSCVEAMDQKIHVVLITNDIELLRTAKCYPIHCYPIQLIKNFLAPKPNAKVYKQMKITIQNDTDAKFAKNSSAIKRNSFHSENEDLNETEKEILRSFNQVNSNGNSSVLNGSLNSKKKCIENAVFPKTTNSSSLIQNDCSGISNQNSKIWNTNAIVKHSNSNENSKISNSGSISIDSTIANIKNNTSNSIVSNKNSMKSNENSSIFDTKALTTVWRYAASDITDASINVDMEHLNLKEKTLNRQKIPETTTRTENRNSDTVSFFFQKATPKFDFQKFKKVSRLTNGGEKTFVSDEKQKPIEDSVFEMEKANAFATNKTIEPRSVFEINEQTKRSLFENDVFKKPHSGIKQPIEKDSVFEMEKANAFATNKTIEPRSVFEINEQTKRSIFENDVFKNPQSVHTNYTNLDLSKFYVKSKVMDNRLTERIDEWTCSFTQIMEESLTGVMEKLSPTVLKNMAPPWSFYEALQCSKNVYKDHVMVKNIVNELSGCLFENDYRIGKLKKNIAPNVFMKAFGCGFQLIKYLKNILEHSACLLDAEESLTNMLQKLEDPMDDINEPLVKAPAESKTDDKEVRHNFVKNRCDIINYLKKHYPAWESYDETENNKIKITRTFGRDLNLLKLDKKFCNKDGDVSMNIENNGIADIDTSRTKAEATFETTTKDVDNVAKYTELEQKKKKLAINNDIKKAELETTQDTPNVNVKPKIISIFDFVKPKDTKIYNQENQVTDSKYVKSDKFKIDSNMLGVKINVPNDYKKSQERDDKFDKERTEKQCKNTDLIDKSIKVTPIKSGINKPVTQKDQEIDRLTVVFPKGIKENGPKIFRNVHLIEEFEERLKKHESYLDELDYNNNSLESYDDDVIHYSKTNDHLNATNKNDSGNATKVNDINYVKVKNTNVNPEINKTDHINNKDNDKISEKDKKINETDNIIPKIHNDIRNDNKCDKDDMTNDSGIGNDGPHIYSAVKSFSSELEGSLEVIQTLIDGSLHEFREGRLRKRTKNIFRLQAFEANFMLTKIINRLNKLVQKETEQQNEVLNEKLFSKNVEPLLKCLEQAQILRKTLNHMLSVTNENVSFEDLNSSMSLNLSS